MEQKLITNFYDKSEGGQSYSDPPAIILTTISQLESQLGMNSGSKYIFGRISHIPDEELKDVLGVIKDYKVWLYGKETAPRTGIHYHFIVKIDEDPDNSFSDKEIIEGLRTHFKIVSPSIKQNPRYLMIQMLLKYSAFSYALKDGEFKYEGFTEEQINLMTMYSYKKYNKTTFAQEYDKIVVNPKLTADEKLDLVIALKSKYNQLLNSNWLLSFYSTMKAKESHESIREISYGVKQDYIRKNISR